MKTRTYKEATDYIDNLIPYQTYEFSGEIGLLRMKYLLSLLGDPQDKFPSIHVAGTSGKGSTSYLIAKILQESGCKTGLHISPHLETERERMQINGKLISKKDFVYFLNKIIPISEIVAKSKFGKVTYYEFLLALTFLYFKKEGIEVGVIETGLGGTYDGTNVLKPKIAVITPIGFDHMHMLGNTLKEIADNKAGIIKNGQLAVISAFQKKEAEKVLWEKVSKENVPFFEEGKDFFASIKEVSDKGTIFSYKSKRFMFENIYCSLLGMYQVSNASIAIRTIEELQHKNFIITEDVVRKALGNAFFPGRLDVRKIKGKTFVLDGAHNEDKMEALMESIKKIWPNKKIICIAAFKDDKNIYAIAKSFINRIDKLIITKFSSYTDMGKYRGMDQKKVIEEIKKAGLNISVQITDSVGEAINKALKESAKDELVLITGSLYLVGEALKVLKTSLNPQVSS